MNVNEFIEANAYIMYMVCFLIQTQMMVVIINIGVTSKSCNTLDIM